MFADISEFCTKTAELLRFVGYLLLIFKIVIPMIIIVYGMIDFGKAVVAEKDDDIKKSAKSLGRRAIAGIIIFFIPTIVVWVFGQIGTYGSDKLKFQTCEDCLLHPMGESCTDANPKAEED